MKKEENKKAEEKEKNTKDLEAKCEEYLNGWKRERADFLNYKKDEIERIGQLVKYANEEIILKLLPVLDNLCLAVKHIKDDGVLQIKKQLEDFLAKEGIRAIETSGKHFDPATMEAIEKADQAPNLTETSAKTNMVVEEIQRGYTMHEKVIRPAKVRVAK